MDAEPPHVDPHQLGLELPEDREAAVQLLLNGVGGSPRRGRPLSGGPQARRRRFRQLPETDAARSGGEHRARLPTRRGRPHADHRHAGGRSQHRGGEPGGEETPRRRTRDLDACCSIRSPRKVSNPSQPSGPSSIPSCTKPCWLPNPAIGRLIVTQEMRRGYTLKGRLLRAALVAVDHE